MIASIVFHKFLLLSSVFFTTSKAYDLSDEYESKNALKRQNELWDIIVASGGGLSSFRDTSSAQKVFREDLDDTFDHFGDDLPYEHKKRIHAVGGVGKALWKPCCEENHSYTGVFDVSGGDTLAMVRFSTALSPRPNYIPGIGVKLFRDSMPSANFLAMNSVDGQQRDGNFFAEEFSNHIPSTPQGAAQRRLVRHFEKFSIPAHMVGLSDMASYDNQGVPVANATFPYQLRLVPNADLREQFADQSAMELENLLGRIPSGTKLWDVHAIVDPQDNEWVKIAEIVSSSEIVYSKAGDQFLFFRHQRMSDDVDLRPEWADFVFNEESGRRALSGHPCPGLRHR